MKAAMDECVDKTIDMESDKEYRFTEIKKK